jgi:hypothetical protein
MEPKKFYWDLTSTFCYDWEVFMSIFEKLAGSKRKMKQWTVKF